MADGAELVRMRLTFWHNDKGPGDIVEVRRDELHRWKGYAVPAEDTTDTTAKAVDDTAPAKTLTKTTTGKQA